MKQGGVGEREKILHVKREVWFCGIKEFYKSAIHTLGTYNWQFHRERQKKNMEQERRKRVSAGPETGPPKTNKKQCNIKKRKKCF